jgi:glyoxylase-like metal-dependent hydrolase (beta-lactamase superfamily II)
VDWAIRHFHGYELTTHRGSSYNAYLITDEKNVLVDTVWGPFQDQLIENIRQVIDPAKIDIVVANHSETDHAGGLPAVMRHCPSATLVVSKRGRESVEGHFHQPWNFKPVQTGDRINIDYYPEDVYGVTWPSTKGLVLVHQVYANLVILVSFFILLGMLRRAAAFREALRVEPDSARRI